MRAAVASLQAQRTQRLRLGEELVKRVGGRSRRVLVTGLTRTTCTVQLLNTGGGGRVLQLGESGLPDGYERATSQAGGGQ